MLKWLREEEKMEVDTEDGVKINEKEIKHISYDSAWLRVTTYRIMWDGAF